MNKCKQCKYLDTDTNMCVLRNFIMIGGCCYKSKNTKSIWSKIKSKVFGGKL